MIEAPLLQRMMAKTMHRAIEGFLEGRFGVVPTDVSATLRTIMDVERLEQLVRLLARCPDLDAVRRELTGVA
jgi:hypothetical protein